MSTDALEDRAREFLATNYEYVVEDDGTCDQREDDAKALVTLLREIDQAATERVTEATQARIDALKEDLARAAVELTEARGRAARAEDALADKTRELGEKWLADCDAAVSRARRQTLTDVLCKLATLPVVGIAVVPYIAALDACKKAVEEMRDGSTTETPPATGGTKP